MKIYPTRLCGLLLGIMGILMCVPEVHPQINKVSVELSGQIESEKKVDFAHSVVSSGDHCVSVWIDGSPGAGNEARISLAGAQSSGVGRTKEIELSLDGGKIEYQFTVATDQGVWAFAKVEEKGVSVSLYGWQIDPVSLAVHGSPRQFLRLAWRNDAYPGKFGFELSANRSYVLLWGMNAEPQKPNHIVIKALNDKMVEEWSTQDFLERNSQVLRFERAGISNGGAAFVSAKKLYGPSPYSSSGEPAYDFVLIRYKNGKSEPETGALKVPPGKWVSHLSFVPSDGNHIHLGGFISNAGSWGVRSIFLADFNLDDEEIHLIKETPLPDETMNPFLSQKQKKKRDKKGENIEIRLLELYDMVARPDGSYILISEQGHDMPINPGGYLHIRNYLLIANLKPDGTIGWTVQIPKYQISERDGALFSGYAWISTKTGLYLVYNDDQRNQQEQNWRMREQPNLNLKHWCTYVSVVDDNGNLSTSELICDVESGLSIPSHFYRMRENALLINTRDKKNLRFATIHFP